MNRTSIAALVGILWAFSAGAVGGQPSTAAGSLANLSRVALTKGTASEFYGYLALGLGLISEEHDVPVTEWTLPIGREDERAVSITANRDILFIVQMGEEVNVYLTSTDGALRKALRVKVGEVPRELSLSDAARGFEREKKFWIETAEKPPK